MSVKSGNSRVTITLPSEDLEMVKKLASEDRRTVSSFISILISEKLKQVQK